MCTPTTCPATALNEVVASLATQGYFMHADILFMVENTDFGLWAPMLYIISAFSGLLMMALGQPPRTYIWFMVGPGIYHWLMTPTGNIQGVAWSIGTIRQDDNMKNVWNISEIGLLNTSYYRRFQEAKTVNEGTNSRNYSVSLVTADDAPSVSMHVAYPFLWFDELVSGTAAAMVTWLGVGVAPHNDLAECSNTHSPPEEYTSATAANWSTLSNSKWPLLENVTSSALHNNDLREAFITFMASECGDVVQRYINKSVYVNATHAHGRDIPTNLFDNAELGEDLMDQIIPVPDALRELLKEKPIEGDGDTTPQTFLQFIDGSELVSDDKTRKNLEEGNWRSVSCSAFLTVLMQGFRFEAGNTYHQMVRQARDKNVDEEHMVYSFLYGWRVPNGDGGDKPDLSNYCGQRLNLDQQKSFLQSLILVYIMRNELAMVPNPVNVRFTGSERTIDYTEAYQRNIGSKNKYGELYTWAKMMPYMQGITIFLLSMAYPIVCMVVVVPGWYKAIFTWMGFFAWAKSWDVGFAVVMLLEEGVWAMIGNNDNAASINFRVNYLERYTNMKVECPGGNEDLCYYPQVTAGDDTISLDFSMEILEESMLLAPNLDVDLSNSYYVYLMSALYFAVPAVTGQILLGSKAAVAGMVTNAVAPGAQEAGKAAGQGATADVQNHGATAQSVVGQTAYGKSMRSGSASGFAENAINAGNHGLDAQGLSGAHGVAAQLAGNKEKMSGLNLAGDHQASYLMGAIAGKLSGDGKKTKGSPIASSPAAGQNPGTGGDPARMLATLGRIKGLGQGAAGWYGSVGQAAYRSQAQNAHGQRVAGYVNDGFKSSAQGSLQGALGRGHETNARRQQSGAEFSAQGAQWKAMRNWSRQVSGNAAAMGVMAGAFTPGPKPTGFDGMAATGMLDTFSGSAGLGGDHKDQEGGSRSGRYFYTQPGEGGQSGYSKKLMGSEMYGQFMSGKPGAYKLKPEAQMKYSGGRPGAAAMGGLTAPVGTMKDLKEDVGKLIEENPQAMAAARAGFDTMMTTGGTELGTMLLGIGGDDKKDDKKE